MKIGHAASGLKQKFAGLGREIWKRKLAYLFIAPLIIGLLIFSYYPPVYGLTLSICFTTPCFCAPYPRCSPS